MPIVVTRERSRWALLGAYTGGLVGLGVALTRGVPFFGTVARVDLLSKPVLRSLGAIAWAPLAWNVVPRLEFRRRVLSKLLGSRSAAHYAFAAYIVLFSSLREKVFFEAIDGTTLDALSPQVLSALRAVGTGLLAFGGVLSAAGFYHLRVRFTYMGEYFGFRMQKLITGFPFNAFPDPMYNGSVLMHFGYALRAASPTGFFLACATGLSYWTAAKIFEEEWMIRSYELSDAEWSALEAKPDPSALLGDTDTDADSSAKKGD